MRKIHQALAHNNHKFAQKLQHMLFQMSFILKKCGDLGKFPINLHILSVQSNLMTWSINNVSQNLWQTLDESME